MGLWSGAATSQIVRRVVGRGRFFIKPAHTAPAGSAAEPPPWLWLSSFVADWADEFTSTVEIEPPLSEPPWPRSRSDRDFDRHTAKDKASKDFRTIRVFIRAGFEITIRSAHTVNLVWHGLADAVPANAHND